MTSNQLEIINKISNYVKIELLNAEGGHDWWHILRVWNNAKLIAKQEQCNEYVVNLGALLHDIADSKFYDGNEDIGPEKARAIMESLKIEKPVVADVISIIRNISYKNSFGQNNNESIELKIVRDADRLDAIGAIGIARTFNYGGHTGSEIYNPDIPPVEHKTKEEYKNSKSTTINHFYEKLLKLKDLMHTETGKKLALKRHEFMLKYLDQFYNEWDGLE